MANSGTGVQSDPIQARPCRRTLMPFKLFVMRCPLAPWAAAIRAELQAAAQLVGSVDSLTWCSKIVGLGNIDSLVLSYAGHVEEAAAICRAQIRWVRELMDSGHDRACAEQVLQPWVNFGRLLGRTGYPDEALRVFADILACASGTAANIDGQMIDRAAWCHSEEKRKHSDHFGQTVYVLDSLKVLHLTRRYEPMLDLARSGVANGNSVLMYCVQEAEIVALGQLGRTDEALARLDQYQRGAGAWERIVLHIRHAELLYGVGKIDAARAIYERLVALCLRLRISDAKDLSLLLIVEQVIMGAAALDVSTAWVTLAEEMYLAAQRINDELLQIELLQALVEHGRSCSRIAEYDRALTSVLNTTAYARFRPSYSRTTEAGDFPALYSEMMNALAV